VTRPRQRLEGVLDPSQLWYLEQAMGEARKAPMTARLAALNDIGLRLTRDGGSDMTREAIAVALAVDPDGVEARLTGMPALPGASERLMDACWGRCGDGWLDWGQQLPERQQRAKDRQHEADRAERRRVVMAPRTRRTSRLPGSDRLPEGWQERVRVCPIGDTARMLGMEIQGSSASPCPSCGEEKRSSRGGDRRGAVFLATRYNRWKCYRCNAEGNGLDLVSVAVLGHIRWVTADDARQVEQWVSGSGLL
jgi:hypothetical protein